MANSQHSTRRKVTALWLLCFVAAASRSAALVVPPLSRSISITSTDTCGVAICFAIDESGSIGKDNFAKIKEFVIDLIDGVSTTASVAQYGASEFSTTAKPVIGLASMTSNAAAAKKAISDMKYNGGYTNMEGGIAECFRVENGVKSGIMTRNIIPNLPRILFLLTDGKPNYKYTDSPPRCPCKLNKDNPAVCQPEDYISRTDTSQCASEATSLRAAAATADGIKFITVGVGGGVNATFLRSLGDYYPVADFSDLQAAVDDILKAFCSDVMLTKSASDSPQPVGGSFKFRIDVLNTGKYAIQPRINFTDTLPAGLSYDTAAGVQPVGTSPAATCSFDSPSRRVFCTINAVLPVGRTWSYTLGAGASTSGNWTNTAEVFADPDNNPNNNKDSVEVIVSKEPEPIPPITNTDLAITKTVDNPTVTLGTPFTYNITIRNNATQAVANDAFAVDTLPAGLQVITTALPSGCSWSEQAPLECGPVTLAPGASQSYSILVTAEYAGQFDNSAIMLVRTPNTTVASNPAVAPVTVRHTCSKYELNGTTLLPYDCGEGYEFNGDAADNPNPTQETCCIALVPDVSMSKSVAPDTTIVDGVVTYTVTIRNTGDGNAKNVILIDELTEGLVFLSPLPQETAIDCYFPDAVKCGEFRRRQCKQGVLDTLICGPMLLSPGEVKVYSVNAQAVLPGKWSNTIEAVYQTSTNPTNQTVPPDSAEVTVDPTCAHYSSDGSAFTCDAGSEPNPVQANNTSPNQTTCCQKVQLGITKTAAAPSVVIGSDTSFRLLIRNEGDGLVSNITVRDNLPAGFNFRPPLPAGCSSSGVVLTCGPFSLAAKDDKQYTIPVTAVAPGDWINQAVVIQGGDTAAGPAEANVTVTRTCRNYYSDGSRFRCGPGSKYDEASGDNPNPGPQTCCIDCKTCADFEDLCGQFDDGCGATINCTCPEDKPYCHQTSQLLRAARAGFCNDDPFDPSDNVDVSIKKDGPDEQVLVNTEFDFKLTVRVEDGKNGARNVVVTDTLPNGLDLVSVNMEPVVTPDPCAVNQQVITCRIGTMRLAETRHINIRVKASQGATYTNVATVTATADKNSTNNRATKDVEVVCKTCANSYPNLCGSFDNGCGGTVTCTCPSDKPFCRRNPELTGVEAPGYCSDQPVDPTDQLDVSITKTGPAAPVAVGEVFEFRLAARVEQGLQGADDVVVTDTLPAGLELVAVIPDRDCTIRYPTIVCNIGRLDFGVPRFIVIRAKSNFPGTYKNTATITAANDTNPDDNTSTATVVVKEDEVKVNMGIRKTVNTSAVLISNQVSYTLTAENIGERDATNVMVADTLPLGFAFVKPLPQGCIIQPELDNRVLRCGPANVPVGQKVSYVIRAQAVAAGTWDNAAVVTADKMPGYKGPVSARVTVSRTCSVYNSDGSRFQCSAGSSYNSEQDDNTNPDQQTCCIDCKTCADYPYQCGTFDNECGTTIECECPLDKPICIQGRELLAAGQSGYCSDKNIDPTDIMDVSITKNGPNEPQVVGTEFDFELIVRVEQGLQGATSVVVTDTLPPSLDLVSTSADIGPGAPKPCDVSGRTITCNLGAMLLFETRFITVRVKANRAGRITNTATVEATGDRNDSNDSADKTVQVVCKSCKNSYPGLCGVVDDGCGGTLNCTCPPSKPFCHHGVLLKRAGAPGYCSDKPIDPSSVVDVSITKTGPKGGQVVGQEFDFVLTVRVEDGLDGAQNVVVKDVLPEGLELVALRPGSSCAITYPVITCIFPRMLYSETQLITITVKGNKPGRYINRANVTADNDKDTTNNRDSAAVTVVAGSCCNPDRTCSQVPENQCQGQYQKDLPCSLAICDAKPIRGACCLKNGGCRNNQRVDICANLDGQFFVGQTCAPGLCAPSPSPTPPGTLGACCIASTKTCLEGITQASCQQQRGQWKEGSQCIASFCRAAAGACCIRQSCFDVTSQQCAAQAGGTFNSGSTCSSGVCGAGNCTASWLPCIPCTGPGCTDQCCAGSSCKSTLISGRQYYTCKPDDVCRREGEPCGNCKGGGVCCSGLVCKWSFHSYNGRCTKPHTCSHVGQTCTVDTDCCPGGRCGADKKCRSCSCSKKCSGLLGVRTNKCPRQQQNDCGALSAAAASSI